MKITSDSLEWFVVVPRRHRDVGIVVDGLEIPETTILDGPYVDISAAHIALQTCLSTHRNARLVRVEGRVLGSSGASRSGRVLGGIK